MCFEREPCFEMHMVIAQDVTYQSLNAFGKDVTHTNRLQGEGFSYGVKTESSNLFHS